MRQIKINWKAIPDALKVLGKLGKEHAPSILVGAGVVGFGLTCWFVGEAAVKADTAIERVAEETERNKNDISLKEKLKISAPYYWKAGISGGLSVGCVLVAHKVNLTRISSLGTMYMLAKNELKEVTDKIVETDGQKKMDEINHKIANEVREKTVVDSDDVYDTGTGDILIIDKYMHKQFRGSASLINNALTEMNTRLMVDGEYPLSDFLFELHLPWADADAAKIAVFRANTATDIIHSYQICDWGPMGKDQSKACVLNYVPYLCPSWDFDARMNKYE